VATWPEQGAVLDVGTGQHIWAPHLLFNSVVIHDSTQPQIYKTQNILGLY